MMASFVLQASGHAMQLTNALLQNLLYCCQSLAIKTNWSWPAECWIIICELFFTIVNVIQFVIHHYCNHSNLVMVITIIVQFSVMVVTITLMIFFILALVNRL